MKNLSKGGRNVLQQGVVQFDWRVEILWGRKRGEENGKGSWGQLTGLLSLQAVGEH